MTLSPTERQRARERLVAASEMVSQLNHGERRWRLSIPARPDDDPDLVICAALADTPRLLAALEEAEAEIAALRQLAEDRADYFASAEDR